MSEWITMKHDQIIKKPVVMLNIDSLMPQALEVAVQTGRAPGLKYLMEKGQYISNMVSSFPTMSVTIDSSLLTGTYADKHRIPGLNWLDVSKKEFINYGTGLRETFRIGWRKTTNNMLYRLNNEQLSKNVSTIFEDLAHQGISSASINSFVYRGNSLKQLQVPRIFRTLTTFKDGKWTTEATPIFSLGTFSKLRRTGLPTQVAAGNYRYTSRELRHLIRKNKLPGFTFCIFQDMDARIHFKGPTDLKMITQMDKEIQKLLSVYGSWENALNKVIWIVIGDNGHSATGKKYRETVIDLRKHLKKYRIVRIEKSIQKKDEIAICVNQRMAYVYLLNKNISLSSIVKQLKKDRRIDVLAWKNEGSIQIESGANEGVVTYRRGGKYYDSYGQSWQLEGDLDLLDIHILNGNIITYGDYPDVLARVYGALHSHNGCFLIVNAKPGYEFKAQSTPFHLSGAAHGSLHRQESLVPCIIAGTNEKPKSERFVDLKEYVLHIVGDN